MTLAPEFLPRKSRSSKSCTVVNDSTQGSKLFGPKSKANVSGSIMLWSIWLEKPNLFYKDQVTQLWWGLSPCRTMSGRVQSIFYCTHRYPQTLDCTFESPLDSSAMHQTPRLCLIRSKGGLVHFKTAAVSEAFVSSECKLERGGISAPLDFISAATCGWMLPYSISKRR